jgi:hypothetical protein
MANQHPPLSTTTAIISPQYCAPGMNEPCSWDNFYLVIIKSTFLSIFICLSIKSAVLSCIQTSLIKFKLIWLDASIFINPFGLKNFSYTSY